MSDYDSMSVHELVMHTAAAACMGQYDSFVLIESALRKAVIREASVGYVVYHETYYGGNLTYDGVKQDLVGEAKYDLIPKETP